MRPRLALAAHALQIMADEANDPELRSVAAMSHATLLRIEEEAEVAEVRAAPQRAGMAAVFSTLCCVCCFTPKLDK
jgi:hypothetical protein